MEGRGVKQDLISNVEQMKFASVPVKGWIIDPEVHDLLYGLSGVLHLSTHYGEIVHIDVMQWHFCYINNSDKYGPTLGGCQNPPTFPLVPCVSLQTSNGVICGKYNFGNYNISL